ncbi:MAG: dTMP kinase [bacterium]|nr:dTMP kinase [bacterium]
MRGFLITFEGLEGSGKSTQVNLLYRYLLSVGYDVIQTQEPGGTKIGAKIRKILLSRSNACMSSMTELLLFASERAQHVYEVIKPALASSKVVICDRFIDSSIAYQGYGRGQDLEMIQTLNRITTNNIIPDLTIVIDIEPNKGLLRTGKGDRIEHEDYAFYQAIRTGYLKIAEKEPNRVKVVEGDKGMEGLHQVIRGYVDEALRGRFPGKSGR